MEKLTVRIPEDVMSVLRDKADKDGSTLSDAAREVIVQAVAVKGVTLNGHLVPDDLLLEVRAFLRQDKRNTALHMLRKELHLTFYQTLDLLSALEKFFAENLPLKRS